SSRVIVYRWLVPSARAETHPLSASAFRWRLTVDCGSCIIPQSSDTVSSFRSSSSRSRLRVVSASEARWSWMAGALLLKASDISVNPDGWIKRQKPPGCQAGPFRPLVEPAEVDEGVAGVFAVERDRD